MVFLDLKTKTLVRYRYKLDKGTNFTSFKAQEEIKILNKLCRKRKRGSYE
jgi:hypothetical protein